MLLCVASLAFIFSTVAQSQIIGDVLIKPTTQGYQIEVEFIVPLRYQSHTPQKSGTVLEVLLSQKRIGEAAISGRTNLHTDLNWDKSTGVPLIEINFNGELKEKSILTLHFSEHVSFEVRNSNDLRSIIVDIHSAQTDQKQRVASSQVIVSNNLVTALKASEPKLADLLDRANSAMLDHRYSEAVQLFTKIHHQSSGEVRRHAQELIGVAREYNGQSAHAKAEYQQYLKDYPEGENAQRVQQRLTALLTAAEIPKAKLKGGRRQNARNNKQWDTQFYGSFSQIYYRDETSAEGQDSQLVRSDLSNDLDFIARARKGDYDLRAQFVGSYREDMRSDNNGSEFLPSIMSIEAGHSGAGLYSRLGRQSRTTGGVLGRFDGMHTAYELGSAVTVNAVFGYPVDYTDRTKVNTEKEFYGVSFDIGTLWDSWDFNTFYIAQDNAGVVDREAMGGEMRYFDPKKSLFTLIDYDIAYDAVNIFLLIGNWALDDDTSFNLVLDYRKSPILTTTNAIQGQAVEQLDELFDKFSEQELKQLAEDRTADNQSITAGLTQQLSDKWQFIGEVTVAEFKATDESGGVEAIPGTGKEYYYSTQWIANSMFYDNDSMILGLRYADTFNADSYSANTNWRINLNRKLRVNPRLRVDYREDKNDDDNRWLARPFIRVDYRLKKQLKLEMDFGYEWLEESFAGETQQTTTYFLSIGYRAQF